MATTTPRIGLTKPDGTDLVDIAVLNTNFDKIDSNIASTKIQSTKPTTANAGDLWWDSDTGTLYLYYTDANSSQWVAATSDPINIGVVANQTERDAQYPTPGQGMRVWRTDLGAEEAYYGLYNVSTNPGGRTPAGWYQESLGRILQVVNGSTGTQVNITSTTKQPTGLSATITPKYANSKIFIVCSSTNFQSAANRGDYAIFRNSTELTIGCSSNTSGVHNDIASGFDSPGITSAITYSFKASMTSGTLETNWSGFPGSLTLMEVAG